MDGELRKRKDPPLAGLARKLYCAKCAQRREDPERHHDVMLVPLRPNEKWPPKYDEARPATLARDGRSGFRSAPTAVKG